MTGSSLLSFPCAFPVKVMGLNTDEFACAVLSVFHKHVGRARITCSRRLSRGDKYLSLTVTFLAYSQDQIDAIYRELHNNELVLMTL